MAEVVTDAPDKVAFVIGPIGKPGTDVRNHADWLLQGVIKPVLEAPEFGFDVKRADGDTNPGSITAAIIHDIKEAALIVADLSFDNPNAYYELGIAHTFERKVVHITNSIGTIPFDNIHQRCIEFGFQHPGIVEATKRNLCEHVRSILKPDHKPSNPVTMALGLYNLKTSGDKASQMMQGLWAEVAMLRSSHNQISHESASIKSVRAPTYTKEILDDGGQSLAEFLGEETPSEILRRTIKEKSERLARSEALSARLRAQAKQARPDSE